MDDGINGHASADGEKAIVDYRNDVCCRICFGLVQKADARTNLPMNVRFRETEKMKIRRRNEMLVFQEKGEEVVEVILRIGTHHDFSHGWKSEQPVDCMKNVGNTLCDR